MLIVIEKASASTSMTTAPTGRDIFCGIFENQPGNKFGNGSGSKLFSSIFKIIP